MYNGQYIHNGEKLTLARYIKEVGRFKHLIGHLASSLMRDKLQGNPFGLLWIALNPIILAGIFSLVFGNVFKGSMSGDYIVYVIIGVVIYDYIAKCIGEPLNLIENSSPFLMQARTPIIVFMLKQIAHLLVLLAWGTLAMLVATLLFRPSMFSINWLWLLVCYPVLIFAISPITIIFALIGDKYRSVRPAVTYLVLILYYLSPVFVPRELYEKDGLATFSMMNPITQALDLIRIPIMTGEMPRIESFITLTVWGAVLWLISIIWVMKKDHVSFN